MMMSTQKLSTRENFDKAPWTAIPLNDGPASNEENPFSARTVDSPAGPSTWAIAMASLRIERDGSPLHVTMERQNHFLGSYFSKKFQIPEIVAMKGKFQRGHFKRLRSFSQLWWINSPGFLGFPSPLDQSCTRNMIPHWPMQFMQPLHQLHLLSLRGNQVATQFQGRNAANRITMALGSRATLKMGLEWKTHKHS